VKASPSPQASPADAKAVVASPETPPPAANAARTGTQAAAPERATQQALQQQPAQPAAATGPAPAAQQPQAEAPARPAAAPTPVPLARAPQTVESVIKLASSRGVTQARIALDPPELGSIEIRLRSTSEGVVARVIADAPQAAQTLQHAAAELRRSLEQQGVNLLGLDIGHSGDEHAASGTHGQGAGTRGGSGDGDGAAGDMGGEETSSETSLRLPDGVLVDVLA